MSRTHSERSHAQSNVESQSGKEEPQEKAQFSDLTSLPDAIYWTLTSCMVRVAERFRVSREQCEDVAQEAWQHAFDHREDFRGERTWSRLFPWLAQIVHNLARDTFRERNRHPTQSLQALAVEPIDQKSGERDVKADDLEWLTVLLERLREEEPENYWLLWEHRINERSVQELAKELGKSANAISCRIYRALRKMRSWAAEDDPERKEPS